MDYAEAREAFFQPRAADAAPAGTDQWDLPGRALRHVLEPIATITFWSEPAYQAYEALGLDFLTGYVWSRCCPLGEPVGEVVAAAFGVFDPDAIAGLYDAARQSCGLSEIRAARQSAARDALQVTIPDDAGVTDTVSALRRGIAVIDTTGRALSAGLSSLDWPDGDRAQLWHAATVLREFRGDFHLAACLAAGLTGLEANILTERRVGWDPLSYTGSRAWSAEGMAAATDRLTDRGLLDGDGLSAAGRRLRDEVEQATERQVTPVLDAIGGELGDVLSNCGRWSQQIIDRGWFPPDAYKRAAG